MGGREKMTEGEEEKGKKIIQKRRKYDVIWNL
jgi:hypothetical protein